MATVSASGVATSTAAADTDSQVEISTRLGGWATAPADYARCGGPLIDWCKSADVGRSTLGHDLERCRHFTFCPPATRVFLMLRFPSTVASERPHCFCSGSWRPDPGPASQTATTRPCSTFQFPLPPEGGPPGAIPAEPSSASAWLARHSREPANSFPASARSHHPPLLQPRPFLPCFVLLLLLLLLFLFLSQ